MGYTPIRVPFPAGRGGLGGGGLLAADDELRFAGGER